MPVRSGSVFCQMCRRRDTKPLALPSDRLEFAKIAETIGEAASAEPHLLHHVGLGRVVEVGLHGGGREHHLERQRPVARQIRAHDPVARLRHHGHVGDAVERVDAEPEPGDVEALVRALHQREVRVELVAGLVDRAQRRAGELELPARLERDARAAFVRERDRLARLEHRRPAGLACRRSCAAARRSRAGPRGEPAARSRRTGRSSRARCRPAIAPAAFRRCG